MAKGFGSNKSHTNLVNAISELIEEATQGKLVKLTVPLSKKQLLSEVVNSIAPKFKEVHFQVFEKTGNDPALFLLIALREAMRKGFSYTWVEQSKLTKKWLVMASPPGSFHYGCLSVWKEQNSAIFQANEVFEQILWMPVHDWKYKRGKYKELIKFLPRDEDSVIGFINKETGQATLFDQALKNPTTEHLFYAVLRGDLDAIGELEASLNHLIEESV
jgi:hypothetical protein